MHRFHVMLTAGALTAVLLLTASMELRAAKDGNAAAAAQKKSRGNKAKAAKPDVGAAPSFKLSTLPKGPRPQLPPSKLPLEFVKGERIAFVGGSLAERFNLFGHFETLLQAHFADKQLVVRNFARPADEVAIRQRASDYTKLDDPITAFSPDTFFCFFGFNESFAGADGVAKFQTDYETYLDEMTAQYPRPEAGPVRFVLVTPAAFERPHVSAEANDTAPQRLAITPNLLPKGDEENDRLRLYSAAVKSVATKRELAVIDLFTPTEPLFNAEPGLQYSINGCHANEAGDRAIGQFLMQGLGVENAGQRDSSLLDKLRAAVNDKSWIHCQDYRMLNGWYVYGGRRTWDTETFPREFIKIRNMAAVRDQYVWDIAQGKPVPARPDDSRTGTLIVPETRFGLVTKSEAETPRVISPEEDIKSFSTPPGFEVKLFASEREFPQLTKPCQLSFDDRGRLWASCMPTYPQWLPGDGRPSDRLLIFEDTNHDGRADACKSFYDHLHCPTGFEFWEGGVLVVDQPRLLWLKDTDGDDRADLVVQLLDGWATDDTHHTVGAFESSPGGIVHMLEGIAMSTAVETPWGPMRNFGSSGAYRMDPRALRITHFNTPGYGNPWCYVFNSWGQGFCGDGTGGNQHWDSPLSGAQFRGRRGLNAIFNNEGMRPVVGSEFLYSRQFPASVQGDFIYACVINMNGLTRFTVKDDGAGFSGARKKKTVGGELVPDDFLSSTDKHFRPVDPQIGPDGALWFGDWANPLIGHMQYSQRDPNRDRTHGRIYRMVYKEKPLLTPVTQQGKSIADLLEQLREPELRTRARARSELHARPAGEVLAGVNVWLQKMAASASSDDAALSDRLLTEALWLEQCFHQIDEALLKRVLTAKTSDARAAAVRVVADQLEFYGPAFHRSQQASQLAESRLPLLAAAVQDDNARVRLEAVRALSFVPTVAAIDAAYRVASKPMDYWLSYTLAHTIGALEHVWKSALDSGEIAKRNPAEAKYLTDYGVASAPGVKVQGMLDTLLSAKAKPRDKVAAMTAFTETKGNVESGKAVFRRTCLNCHRVSGEGFEYGPDMNGVAKRLKPFEIVESILEPNKKVDPKYLATVLSTDDGLVYTGLVVAEDDRKLTMKVAALGKPLKTIEIDKSTIEERQTLKQSSMPEGMVNSLSPLDFLDLVEFLKSLKQ